eukprot:9486958-Pyramimonas_sp.AAC.1
MSFIRYNHPIQSSDTIIRYNRDRSLTQARETRRETLPRAVRPLALVYSSRRTNRLSDDGNIPHAGPTGCQMTGIFPTALPAMIRAMLRCVGIRASSLAVLNR